MFRAIPSHQKGRIMIVAKRGAGCGGRWGADNERRWGGRPSRVVLTPRRWCQVSWRRLRETTVAKKPGAPGRSRSSR